MDNKYATLFGVFERFMKLENNIIDEFWERILITPAFNPASPMMSLVRRRISPAINAMPNFEYK